MKKCISILLLCFIFVMGCGQKQSEPVPEPIPEPAKTEETIFSNNDAIYSSEERDLYIDAPDIYAEAIVNKSDSGGIDDDKNYHYFTITLSDNTKFTCETYVIDDNKIIIKDIICKPGGEKGYLKEVIASKYAVYKIIKMRIENRSDICGD